MKPKKMPSKPLTPTAATRIRAKAQKIMGMPKTAKSAAGAAY